MAADFHHLFVTDHQHVLFMSEFPHLESGRGTVLASQSPPPRPNKETSSQQRAGPESGRAVPPGRQFPGLCVQRRPCRGPAGPPRQGVSTGMSAWQWPEEMLLWAQGQQVHPPLRQGACGCSHPSFMEGRGQAVLGQKGRRLAR